MNFALTKQWGKIDFRVWMSLIVLAFISLGLFGYKVATTAKCPDMKIELTGKLSHADEKENTFFVNEQVTFAADIKSLSKNIVWDFGDKTQAQTGAAVSHIFTKEGNYLVTLTIDDKCSEAMNVRVIQGNSSISGDAPNLNPIVSNDIVSLGEETIFNTTAQAQTYTWSVDELPELGQINTPTAKFIFNKPGNFTVSLLLDNGMTHKKIIQVSDPLSGLASAAPLPPSTPSMDIPPAPSVPLPMPETKKEEPEIVKKEEPKPEEPAAKPQKTYDQLPLPTIKAMIVDITEGKKDAGDFDKILCNGAGTKVMANNESTTFAALVNELKEKKGVPLLKRKRKIQDVKVVRDQANGNCVSILYVDYK